MEILLPFYQQQVPAVAKKSGEDFLSVMSYDGPSAVRKKQSLMSLHEHGAFHMPPPPVFNREDSPCPFSLQRSPQLPTASTMPEISALEALEVSQDKHECKAGRAVPRPPLASSGEPHVSNQNLAWIINDSSSSKSNMELVSASTKTEGDDNSECSSSNVVAALAAGEDQSEKDQSISPNAVAFWSLAWQNLWFC
ncbi:hypothetical protein OIU76_010207 [Salix suchowensis]|nr:hypothetical protein OIU76_010207 [Salix suchowensis]